MKLIYQYKERTTEYNKINWIFLKAPPQLIKDCSQIRNERNNCKVLTFFVKEKK